MDLHVAVPAFCTCPYKLSRNSLQLMTSPLSPLQHFFTTFFKSASIATLLHTFTWLSIPWNAVVSLNPPPNTVCDLPIANFPWPVSWTPVWKFLPHFLSAPFTKIFHSPASFDHVMIRLNHAFAVTISPRGNFLLVDMKDKHLFVTSVQNNLFGEGVSYQWKLRTLTLKMCTSCLLFFLTTQ